MAITRLPGFILDSTTSFTFANISVTSNVTANNANLGNAATANYFIGVLTTAAQPNITSVGTLTSLEATGNITGNFFIGNGSQLTGLSAGTATTAVTITANAQPNITSTGTLTSLITSGDATIGGNLTVNGTTTTINATTLSVTDLNITVAKDATTAAAANNAGITVAGAAATILYISTTDTWNFNKTIVGNLTGVASSATVADSANAVAGANVTGAVTFATTANAVAGANVSGAVTFATTANAVAGANVSGAVSLATFATTANAVAGANVTGAVSFATTANAVAGANVTGTVANATYALTSGSTTTSATVTTAAQPNITSVGTLTSLAITGDITSGNANLGNAVTANYFIGNGSMLTGISGGGGGTPGGANTQIQFNDGSAFAGNAGLTFNKTTTVLTANNLAVTATTSLGAVGNITVTGGMGGQVLGTNGSNILSWITPATTSITSTTGITVDTFTGDGSTVVFTLSVTPATITQTQVNYNGVLQLRSAYTLTGSTIVFSEAPLSGSSIEVTTTQGVSATSGSYGVRSYTGTGSLTTFTVTTGSTASSVLVTENGVLQNPTIDYTVSGTVLTFTTAPAVGVSIQIRELGIFVVNTTASTTTDILSPFLLMGA